MNGSGSLRVRLERVLSATPEQASQVDRILAGSFSPPLAPDAPLLLTFTAAAKLAGISRSQLWRLVRRGVIVPVDLGNGFRRVRRSDILRLALEGCR